MCVAIRGQDLENPVADVEHGDVECSSAQVVNGDLFVFLFVEPIGERGGGRLVDDAQNLEAGDLTGGFGRVAL